MSATQVEVKKLEDLKKQLAVCAKNTDALLAVSKKPAKKPAAKKAAKKPAAKKPAAKKPAAKKAKKAKKAAK